MLIRVVRMTFESDKVADFLEIFNQSKDKIRHFEGCMHLELWRDAENPTVFSTYSHWKNAEALENYRQSAFFQSTWKATKQLFADKPVAYSHDVLMKVE
jgi:quinol monooxygenase YgiN